jgi:hypothetical protein
VSGPVKARRRAVIEGNRFVRSAASVALLALAAVVAGSGACVRKEGPASPTATKYGGLLIRGTATMDVDTGTLSPKDRKTRDFHWRQRSVTARCLEAQNGAVLARLGDVDFEKLDVSDLEKAAFSEEPIKGDDDDNQLTPGTVIAIKTNEGNYAKMLVTENIPMDSTSRGKPVHYKFYSMKADVVVYTR